MDTIAGTFGSETLGANLGEYGSAMDVTAEDEDFRWAAVKRRQVVEAVKALAPVGRAADIGCRGGREAAFYRDACGIGEMHGFEIAAEPLERAATRGVVPHVWISGEGPMPVADAFFDVVLALDVIEHIFDTDIFLRELHRAIRPRGHLLVATPNLGWWWSRLRLLRGAPPAGLAATSPTHALDRAIDTKHLRLNVGSEWRHLFASHGFVCERQIGYNYPQVLRAPLRPLDNALLRVPDLAHSYIFVLRKPDRA